MALAVRATPAPQADLFGRLGATRQSPKKSTIPEIRADAVAAFLDFMDEIGMADDHPWPVIVAAYADWHAKYARDPWPLLAEKDLGAGLIECGCVRRVENRRKSGGGRRSFYDLVRCAPPRSVAA